MIFLYVAHAKNVSKINKLLYRFLHIEFHINTLKYCILSYKIRKTRSLTYPHAMSFNRNWTKLQYWLIINHAWILVSYSSPCLFLKISVLERSFRRDCNNRVTVGVPWWIPLTATFCSLSLTAKYSWNKRQTLKKWQLNSVYYMLLRLLLNFLGTYSLDP